MEAFADLWNLAQKLVGAGGWLANLAVAIVGGFALLMKMRGIGREDRVGEQQAKAVEQQGSFQERLLKALERSDAREARLFERMDRLSRDNAVLTADGAEMRVELGLVRNQLRNVTALLRQVRDGSVAPGAIEVPETPAPGAS
ncbi:hypothetical protein [Hansschlegelia zhihuaiae]|uniref:DUF2730 family protein n=1 Tax=Hansschlegelia zhihuaiae TaxID=405005 RepID=A0A4Q0MPS1_9HYPH|nr:hypothetical protein [Hansschlegelia zhihuaiae]RXF75066.1 hypothetical protein EK403_03185 [Hansschlegelia zhihuaiae]